MLTVLVLAGLVWANYKFARFNIDGNGYSIQRIAIQSLEKSGTSPYGDQVTNQIRTAVPAENAFVRDNYPRYTSPLISGLLIFPFTLVSDLTLAHALWTTCQLLAIFVILLVSLKVSNWKPAWYSFFLFALFTIFSFHVIIPWLDGGLPIWAAFFLVLVLVAISSSHNELAGAFLALAIAQPQMVILPVLFILLWSISRRKAVLVLWFFITLILLTVVSLLLSPGWLLEYVRLLFHFTDNFPPGNLALIFSTISPALGKQLGWLVSGFMALILLIEWYLALRKDFRWFLWTVCLTMVISQWIGIPTIPANFIELTLPMVLISALLSERWAHGGRWASVVIALILLLWQWAVLYMDMVGSQPSMQLNLLLPLPVVLLVGLYWVRWWAVKPRRLLIEELRLSEG